MLLYQICVSKGDPRDVNCTKILGITPHRIEIMWWMKKKCPLVGLKEMSFYTQTLNFDTYYLAMALHDTHVLNIYDVVTAPFTFDLRMCFKFLM